MCCDRLECGHTRHDGGKGYTYNGQKEQGHQIINLFHQSDRKAAFVRDNQTGEESAKDRVYTLSVSGVHIGDRQYGTYLGYQ